MSGMVYCAIGDVHGECERLIRLHETIDGFTREELGGAAATVIYLGDLIDRGPDSCGVIEFVMAETARPGRRTITLRGNHEQMMLEALTSASPSSERHWAINGGGETIESYLARGHETVPQAHLDWLASLPDHFADPDAQLVFVHAGVDPDLYPDCGEQVRLWTRKPAFFDPRCWTAPALSGVRIIHGHTPTDDDLPQMSPCGRRLNIDTGAVYGGRLTAAILRPGQADVFLHA